VNVFATKNVMRNFVAAFVFLEILLLEEQSTQHNNGLRKCTILLQYYHSTIPMIYQSFSDKMPLIFLLQTGFKIQLFEEGGHLVTNYIFSA
jgi:hypothetical protein